jgi:hypothetical protein
MQQPQPSELDRLVASARIARLADALLASGAAALPWTRRQPAIAGDLAPIAEVLVEHFARQRAGEGLPDPLEPQQLRPALRHQPRLRWRGAGVLPCRWLARRQLRKLFAH